MSDSAGKEIKSVLIDFPFDVPTFATVSLRERWEKLLTKVDVKEKFNNITVMSSDVEKSISDLKEKLFIIFSDWIVDDWTVEKIAEFEWPVLKADDVVFFENGNGLLPIVLAGENTLASLAKWTEWEHSDNIAGLVDYAKQNGSFSVSVKKLDNSFSARIYDKKSSVAAEWDLLKFLQFRPGGLVAKYLNRPFSIRMTRRIIKFKFVTPNFVTIADFFIGLFGLSLFLIPSYWAAVIGAVIMHFNSIVDGVDGEVARLRHQSSKIGANLDSFSDETLGALLYVVTGYHIMIMGGPGWWPYGSEWFFYIGLFTGIISYTYAMVNFHSRRKKGGIGFYYWWDLNKPVKVLSRKPTLMFYLKRLLWRDSILFIFMLVTIFNVQEYFLMFSFVPAAVNALLMFIHIFIIRAEW